jgi:hypothetical protein
MSNPIHIQDSILQLPMMLAEERILVDFLLNSDEKKINRKETLLLYYLQVIDLMFIVILK